MNNHLLNIKRNLKVRSVVDTMKRMDVKGSITIVRRATVTVFIERVKVVQKRNRKKKQKKKTKLLSQSLD